MDVSDFGGAFSGGLGGLVKWHDGAHAGRRWQEQVISLVTSGVCGSGFGYLTQSVVEWQFPAVPQTVAVGLAFVAGLASGVLSQTAVGLVSEVMARVRGRILDRIDQHGKAEPPATPPPHKTSHPADEHRHS